MSDTNIAVSHKVWMALNQRKQPGDSFDDVLRRLLDQRERDAVHATEPRDDLRDRVDGLDWSAAEAARTDEREAALVDALEVLRVGGVCSRRTVKQILVRSDRELGLAESSRERMAADLVPRVDGVEPEGDSDLVWTGD